MPVNRLRLAVVSYSISTSNHNIALITRFVCCVVSYSISTSNHNFRVVRTNFEWLYLIPFLHQTTTINGCFSSATWLYLIPFLHQTTTPFELIKCDCCCILFHFYIKPQPVLPRLPYSSVVSYSISTSNHNLWRIRHCFQAHYHLNHILIFNGML